MSCGYFPDLLRFKRFPLTPSFHSKRKDKAIHSSSGCPMREAKNPHLEMAAATNPTPNPSQYILVSFHLISQAVRPLQPTPSGSLFSKIQAETTPKRRVHFHHDTQPLKTRLVTLPPLQSKPHGGTTPSLVIEFRIKNCPCILLNIPASIYLLESPCT